MTSSAAGERRQHLLELLGTALEMTPSARPAFLDESCAGDAELRRELRSLLELEDGAAGFLQQPAVRALADSGFEKGHRIGPYRIVELRGRGGMGAVYRAVREDDFEKQVAIKLIRQGLTSEAIVQRFHTERQILARLEHPCIARLLDGGTTDDGRPYLVMEYIDGVAIDTYCETHRLPIRARLELFQQVCSGLAFAHQNLVVHRDLKPGNVLVTAGGVPRLLDFGIAKLLDPDHHLRGAVTPTGERPMTPSYASPEQVRRQPATPKSDIYSLGVLLYLLLTRRMPCDLESCSAEEVSRRICEDEPLRPSIAVDNPRDRRRLAGDVDAIVLKALRKEPRHRYASVEQFSEDIRRHLEGQPVVARKGTWTYRGGKFVRRHRWGLAAMLLILAFSLTTTVLWRRAEQERVRAEQQHVRAERALGFLVDLLKSAHPDTGQGASLTVRELLDQGREELAGFDGEGELEADLAGVLGDVYRNLGFYDDARSLLMKAVGIRRQLHPRGHPALAVALNDLGSLHYYIGDYGAAEDHFREALAMRRRFAQEASVIARAVNNLASALKQQGEYEEAEELYREGLALREEIYSPEDPNVASSLYSLGALHYVRGELGEAEPLLRRALAIRIRAFGGHHTRVASLQNSLGRLLHARGELDEAEGLYRRALLTRRQRLGDEHDHVALSQRDLAALLLDRGELAGAAALLDEALATLRRSKPEGDWTIADTEGVYGVYLAKLGRYEEAEPYVLESYAAVRATQGEHSIITLQAQRRVDVLYEIWNGQQGSGAPGD